MELSPSYHLSPPAAPTDAAQPKHNCKDRHYASPNQTLTHNQQPPSTWWNSNFKNHTAPTRTPTKPNAQLTKKKQQK
jgi:hypothetical protein